MSTRTSPLLTDRTQMLGALARTTQADIVVVGGGATGLGIALDAALRGLKVVVLEAWDFAKGTSSRATKLVHGGVRYLAQGNISLVREALHERTHLLHNAPHLAQPLPFVMPSYKCWETPFYGLGLMAYDALAGREGLGSTQFLGASRVRQLLPGARWDGLKGGVKYWDGQFDDARLALALARTAAVHGALLINYCPVTEILHRDGRVSGVLCQDRETGQDYVLQSPCVVNATGVWVDGLREQDGRESGHQARPMVAPSQGVHLVVDQDFLPGEHALLVPRTRDGRVLFAVPWLGKLILGTTDTPRQDVPLEPKPLRQEVDFILSEAAHYLQKAPQEQDVRSVWVGLRPLVRPVQGEGAAGSTQSISREHTVLLSQSGLVTVTGGKWTTYRAMAQDVLEQCEKAGLVGKLPACSTVEQRLVGASHSAARRSLGRVPGVEAYGSESDWVKALPGADVELAPGLTQAMVVFACRYEYARTVEDMLARRSRLLFLDAALAQRVAPTVAQLMQTETGHDPELGAFLELARQYAVLPSA
ncbi:glycerol-3-phosphate dehydrogenase/oxidase [Alcaligenes sp. SDU_A2]|uniref:glycerol-3-phosphate dehydrogenase/oxidase n=1 Tax=Alcaligenes sp. SDU_A2 TaxID=3136634 RepID=UPI00311D893D